MKFLLATKNLGKLAEMQRILLPLGIEVISERDLPNPLDEVEETGVTFEENAYLKAIAGLSATGYPCIADDSGLCVDYLDGAPGIYSARFASEECDSEKNIDKLLNLLEGVPTEKRTAYFISTVVCVFPDGRKFSVSGKCNGYIGTKREGTNGFGYDAVFVSEKGSFATLTASEKDEISHRGKAFSEFAQKIKLYI